MNHSTATRVAARPLHQTDSPPLRAELRAAGAEFEQLIRDGITELVAGLAASPAPRMMYADIARGRPASLTTIGAALAGVARSPDAPAGLERFSERLAVWVRSLTTRAEAGLYGAWSSETADQGDADVALAAVLIAPSVPALDRAIRSTARHMASQRAVLEELTRKRRAVLLAGGRPFAGVRS